MVQACGVCRCGFGSRHDSASGPWESMGRSGVDPGSPGADREKIRKTIIYLPGLRLQPRFREICRALEAGVFRGRGRSPHAGRPRPWLGLAAGGGNWGIKTRDEPGHAAFVFPATSTGAGSVELQPALRLAGRR